MAICSRQVATSTSRSNRSAGGTGSHHLEMSADKPADMAGAGGDAAQALPTPRRFITDHDSAGKAVFNTTLPEELRSASGDPFLLAYATVRLASRHGQGAPADSACYQH